MEEFVCQKATGQRRELVKKLWKDDCEKEEIISLERWENTYQNWFKKYGNIFDILPIKESACTER